MPPKKNARKVCGRFFLREKVGFQRGRAGRSIQVSHQLVPLFSDGLICFDYGCGRHEAFVVGIVAAGAYVADETAIGRRRIGGRATATAATGRVAGRPERIVATAAFVCFHKPSFRLFISRSGGFAKKQPER